MEYFSVLFGIVDIECKNFNCSKKCQIGETTRTDAGR